MKICSITGCNGPHYGRGWCAKHYRRWLRHGDPETVLRPSRHVVQHGTVNEYQNYGCRCEPCHNAAMEYEWQRRQTTCSECGKAIWTEGHRPMSGLCRACYGLTQRINEHGSNGMYKRGCRCAKCRGHAAENKRRWRSSPEVRERERAADRRRQAAQKLKT